MEAANPVVAGVALDALPEIVVGSVLHQLREDRPSLVHRGSWAKVQPQNHRCWDARQIVCGAEGLYATSS
jgi:hypothetical protein